MQTKLLPRTHNSAYCRCKVMLDAALQFRRTRSFMFCGPFLLQRECTVRGALAIRWTLGSMRTYINKHEHKQYKGYVVRVHVKPVKYPKHENNVAAPTSVGLPVVHIHTPNITQVVGSTIGFIISPLSFSTTIKQIHITIQTQFNIIINNNM